MVQDGLCQSLKTTSRCDMDTVDVDVKDLIFSTSILGKITGFFCGPKTGLFSPKKGPVKRFVSPWEDELLGCKKFRSGKDCYKLVCMPNGNKNRQNREI